MITFFGWGVKGMLQLEGIQFRLEDAANTARRITTSKSQWKPDMIYT